ncbi:hypothetical protein [Paenibacillus odorifer]|jgi:hypothetical protein|uniref:Uncharacterized protein n=1 Tax=Paenibacillus odorifer TaxID=189426 RepID=A0AAD0P5L6_9BACL|nr:hypothetical protein [Paenibacillus odorifer]AWV35145.1 hypothetical protein CD191_22300 [Paenibacillus odorifer]
MELDTKQKLLISIYSEYQKDLPDMDNVTFESLGVEYLVFKVAVDKLMNEGLINGAVVTFGGRDAAPLHVNIKHCKMTPYGILYVEKKLEIDETLSGEQKVRTVIEKAGKWGWDQFKDFGARVIVEMLK